jgi:hypothetical protein
MVKYSSFYAIIGKNSYFCLKIRNSVPMDIDFIFAKEYTEADRLSAHLVRIYCAQGKIQGVRLAGKNMERYEICAIAAT